MIADKIVLGPDQAAGPSGAGEPFGDIRGEAMTVTADDGLPLHVEISGPADAPVTIIFCHGYTLNQDVWYYQRAGLSRRARGCLPGPAQSRPVRAFRSRPGQYRPARG